MQRLVGDAAGQRPVADHRGDLAVLADPLAHRLLEPDRVADRGRGVAGAHDVVLGLEDRAERGQAAVLADRRQCLAPAGEDLVRVGLVADVPEHLVARRVEQAVQRHRQLAGAEVGPEVAADLTDRVDDVGAHLLRHPLQLGVVEAVQVGRAVDPVEQARLAALALRSVFRSRSFVSGEDVVGDPPQVGGVALGLGQRGGGLRVGLGGELARSLEAEEADVGELPCRASLPEACRAARRSRSRRGCRRRSGRGRRARWRTGDRELSQVRRDPRGRGRRRPRRRSVGPVFSS